MAMLVSSQSVASRRGDLNLKSARRPFIIKVKDVTTKPGQHGKVRALACRTTATSFMAAEGHVFTVCSSVARRQPQERREGECACKHWYQPVKLLLESRLDNVVYRMGFIHPCRSLVSLELRRDQASMVIA